MRPHNLPFANGRLRFANGAEDDRRLARRLSRIPRDLALVLTHRRLWATCLLLIAVFSIAGPFATLERLPPLGRVAYWGAVMTTSWVIGTFHVVAAVRLLPQRWPEPLRAALGGAAMGPVVMAFVASVNRAVFGADFLVLPDPLVRIAVFAAVGAAMAMLVRQVDPVLTPLEAGPSPEAEGTATVEAAAADEVALLQRLPAAKRGPLVRLSMQDHYVEVVTDAGSELVLLRLSDAIAEAAPTPGRQIHRSHWVAEAAVRGARREGGRLLLSLSDGTEAPVSRARAQALREAGWV